MFWPALYEPVKSQVVSKANTCAGAAIPNYWDGFSTWQSGLRSGVKQPRFPPNTPESECRAFRRASKFVCVDSAKPWRCPVQSNGAFECSADPQQCAHVEGGLRVQRDVRHGELKQANLDRGRFKCSSDPGDFDWRTAGATGVPRQFEVMGGHWIDGLGGLPRNIKQLYNKAEIEETGYRTAGVKHIGSNLCILTGALKFLVEGWPSLVLPRWCRPTGCQLSLLPRQNNGGSDSDYSVIEACGDGAVVAALAPQELPGDALGTDASPRLAYFEGVLLSRTPAPDKSFTLDKAWSNVGGKYVYAGVTSHNMVGDPDDSRDDATVCLLTGLIKTVIQGEWEGPKSIQIGAVSNPTNCTQLTAPVESVAAMRVDGKSFVYTQSPPMLRITKQGTVVLVLSKHHKIKGSLLELSLSGAKALAGSSKTEKGIISDRGLRECYENITSKIGSQPCQTQEKSSELANVNASLISCVRDAPHHDGSIQMVGSSEWPAIICMLSGSTRFAKHRSEPGLVAHMSMSAATCFPLRVVQLSVLVEGGGAIPISLEPQGVLRLVHAEHSTAVTLNFANTWYDPDALSNPLNVGRSPALVFPRGATAKQMSTIMRKAIIKDAYVFDGTKCGQWLQKRLICTRKKDSSYKCQQMKRLVRTFKWSSSLNELAECKFNNLGTDKDECKNNGVNRLLAL